MLNTLNGRIIHISKVQGYHGSATPELVHIGIAAQSQGYQHHSELEHDPNEGYRATRTE